MTLKAQISVQNVKTKLIPDFLQIINIYGEAGDARDAILRFYTLQNGSDVKKNE